MNWKQIICMVLSLACLTGCSTGTKETSTVQEPGRSTPLVIGEMRNVMQKGRLEGVIMLDSLATTAHLYGLGPVENLAGEILILDGISYRSSVADDSMVVEQTFQVKAPFFSYAIVERWQEVQLPDSVTTTAQLENFILHTTAKRSQPFFFRVTAIADSAQIHVMALPAGIPLTSARDAHTLGKNVFSLTAEGVELLGFFSTKHQAVFTHHDTFMHIHLITDDRQKMGHMDALHLRAGTAKLFVPAN